jgi:hypothetical protein
VGSGGDPLYPGSGSSATTPTVPGQPQSGPAAGPDAPRSDTLYAAPTAVGGADSSHGSLEAGFPSLPGYDPFGRLSRLVPLATLLSTTTTLALAFLLFGKKRRDEEPTESDALLATAAASPYAMPGSVLAPSFTGFDPGTGGTDINLPRWRRPSLLAARKSDPVRNGVERATLTFQAQGAMAGGERMVVRYRLVQLLDRPDELLGQPVDSVDEGDEVEILERRGTYRLVVAPDGRQGWLHKMTLGEIVPDDSVGIPGPDGLFGDGRSVYFTERART